MNALLISAISYVPFTSTQLGYASAFCAGASTATVAEDTKSKWGWGGGLLAAALWAVKSVKQAQEAKQIAAQKFAENFLQHVATSVISPKNNYTDPARQQMLQIIEQLKKNGFYTKTGNDDFRAPFVGLQGIIEHVLATQKTLKVVPFIFGAIHAPLPPTPLCAAVDAKNIESLMDPSIFSDPDKKTTITERAVTVRRMLGEEGTIFYAIYPEGALPKRKENEQTVFNQELKNYEGKLRVSELSCKELDPDKTGALYLFTDEAGNHFAFSIKAQQANNPQENSTWGIWFGPVERPSVKERIRETSDYLLLHKGPNLPDEFAKQCLKYVKHT